MSKLIHGSLLSGFGFLLIPLSSFEGFSLSVLLSERQIQGIDKFSLLSKMIMTFIFKRDLHDRNIKM